MLNLQEIKKTSVTFMSSCTVTLLKDEIPELGEDKVLKWLSCIKYKWHLQHDHSDWEVTLALDIQGERASPLRVE